MKNRRGFLAALTAASATPLGVVVAARSKTPPAQAASPSPPPAKHDNAPSAAALAVALTYRRFDPQLTDAELHAIAGKIDENRAGPALDPRAKPLRNSDDLVVRFAADERAG